jgi:hypothetical protein
MAGFGLRPTNTMVAASDTGAVRHFMLYTPLAFDLGVYEPVAIANSGSVGQVINFSNGSPGLGIFMGCYYFDSLNNYVCDKTYKANTTIRTNTTATAIVALDYNIIYEAQAIGSSGFTSASVDKNYNLTQLNTLSGLGESTVGIDMGTANTTLIGNPVKFVGLKDNPSNVSGALNNIGLFQFNNHYYRPGTVGIA